MKRFRICLVAVLLSVLSAGLAAPSSQGGALDKRFGKKGLKAVKTGQIRTSFSPVGLVKAPERYLAVGSISGDVAMFGFKLDGSPDRGFGKAGRRYFEPLPGGGDDWDMTTKVLSQGGKLLVAGGVEYPGTGRFLTDQVVTRYKGDGTIDRSFGTRGSARLRKLTVTFDAAVDSRGGILTVSNRQRTGPERKPTVPRRGALTRLTSGGKLDKSYAVGGSLFRSEPFGSSFRTVVVDEQDRALVTIVDSYLNERDRIRTRTSLMRVNASGKIDRGFGDDGLAERLPFAFDPISSLALPDGRVALGGERSGGDGPVIVFYDQEGKLDKSVNGDGVISIDGSGSFDLGGRLEDGIWFGTLGRSSDEQDDSVVTVDENGQVTEFRALPEQGTGVVTAVDGSLVTATGGSKTPVLGRVTPDGSVDSSFSERGGIPTRLVEPAWTGLSRLTSLRDRSLLASTEDNWQVSVARFGRNGGNLRLAGKRFLPVKQPNFVQPAILLPRGGSGFDLVGGGPGAVANVRVRGDRRGIRSTILLEGFKRGMITAGLPLGKGRMLLAGAGNERGKGALNNRSRSTFLLAKYQANGELDRRFGRRGRVKAGFRLEAVPSAIVKDHRGRYLVAGGDCSTQFYCGGGKTAAQAPTFARLTARGRFDRSFGQGGRVQIPYGSNGMVRSVAVLGDGRIAAIIGRTCGHDCPEQRSMMVLRPDGKPDRKFGKRGKLELTGGRFLETTKVFAAGRHGIDVAGTFEPCTGNPGFSVIRLDRHGRRDRSFGGGDGLLHAPGGRTTASYSWDAIKQGADQVTFSGFLELEGRFGGQVKSDGLGRIDLNGRDGRTSFRKCQFG